MMITIKNIVTFNVGIATHYWQNVWIPNEQSEDGGSEQPVKFKYKHPKIEIEFVADTEENLPVNIIFTDENENHFRSISKTRIQNVEVHVEKFSIPTMLTTISKPFNEA